MYQNFAKFWQPIDFPGGSELPQASEGPLKGVKMTVMDIFEFKDIFNISKYNIINGPYHYNKKWFR